MSKNNTFEISIDTDGIKEGLENTQGNMAKAVRATVSDFKKRAPGWVSKGIREVYGVDTQSIKEAKGPIENAGTIRLGGVSVKNCAIKYEGRVLTPVHFKMTPKVRPKRRYKVKAAIFKGQKKVLHQAAFLGSNGKNDIPFIRLGKKRLPIKSIKTLSVPQMITSDKAGETISRLINENMEERLQHNIKRFQDK